MIINPAEMSKSDGNVKIQSLIEYSGKKKYLWYSVPEKFSRYLTTEKLDGFLVGLLPMAMLLGEDIEVKGAVSEKLYFNLVNGYMSILQSIMPPLKKVSIKPQYLDDGKTAKCEDAVVTGFSAGVDSFCTLYDHYFNETLPDHKITHLVFNNVGSHGEWDSKLGRKVFNARYELLKGYPRALGLDFMKIDSNLSDILRWDFEETHVSRNVSAILMLQKLFGKYYYSSSNQYKDCRIGPHYDITLTEPASVHLLSTETLECISVGCQYSRIEKTKRMAKIPEANLWLNVCVSTSSNGKNCSVCYKCCRTMLTLEMLGILYDFKHVFDLDRWKKVKNKYLVRMIGNKKSDLTKEIRAYAKSVGYSLSPWRVKVSDILHFSIGTSGVSLFKLLNAVEEWICLHKQDTK